MRALVLVGHALLGDDGAVAALQAVHHGGAHAARGGAAGHHHRVHAVEVEDGAEVGLEEGRGHALVDDDVALAVDAQSVVELRAPAAHLDVLQRVWRVGARAPDAAVLAGVHVGHVGPHHGKAVGAEGVGQLVDVVQLLRVCLVGGGELAHAGVGLLRIHVDECGLAAEAEALACGVGLGVFEKLARGLVGGLHGRSLEGKVWGFGCWPGIVRVGWRCGSVRP